MDADFVLTGDVLPSDIISQSGGFTMIFSTDSSRNGLGWSFLASSDSTVAPSPPPTGTPSASIVVHELTEALLPYQLGGPFDYLPSDPSFGRNVPLHDTAMNTVRGPASVVLTCFQDVVDQNATYPWVAYNRVPAELQPGFGLIIEGLTLDFSLGNQQRDFNCLDLKLDNLVIRNARMLNFFYGIRLIGDGASLTLENIQVTSNIQGRPVARYFVRGIGSGMKIRVVNSNFENHRVMEGGFKLEGDGLDFEFIGNPSEQTVDLVYGAEQFGPINLKVPVNNCNCSSACFDKSNYCVNPDGSFRYHSFAFVDINLNGGILPSKIKFEALRVRQARFYHIASLLYVNSSLSGKDEVFIKNIHISESTPGDPFFYPTLETRAPTGSPTYEKQPLRPTGSPTVSSAGIVRSFTEEDGDQVPVVSGVAAFEGQFANLTVMDTRYFVNLLVIGANVRRAAMTLKTVGTPLEISNLVLEGSILEAGVFYLPGYMVQGSSNTITVNGLTINNVRSSRLTYQAAILVEDNLLSSVGIENIQITDSNFGVLRMAIVPTTQSLNEYIGPKISLSHVFVNNAQLYFVEGASTASSSSSSGLVAVWIPRTALTSCHIVMSDVIVMDTRVGPGLIQVSCRLSNVSMSTVSVSGITRVIELGSSSASSLLVIPDQVVDGFLRVQNVRVISSECGFASLQSEKYSIRMINSYFQEIKLPVLTLSDNIGTGYMINSQITGSISPTITLQSTLASSPSNRQFIILQGMTFSNNSGLSSGAIQSNSRNGIFEANACNFTKNMAITDSSEDYRALVGDSVVSSRGGAISSSGAVRLTNCIFKENIADMGGALFALELDIRGCRFQSNVGRENGGDIVTAGARIFSSYFVGSNSKSKGGCIWITKALTRGSSTGVVSINGSLFKELASDFGGVVYCDRNTVVTVVNSRISDINTRDGSFFADDSTVLHLNDTVVGDIETVDAGLLHLSINSYGILSGVTVNNIHAQGFGGVAVSESNSVLEIFGSNVSNVRVLADGGVFYVRSGAFIEIFESQFYSISAVSGGFAFVFGGNIFMDRANVRDVNTKTAAIFSAMITSKVKATGCSFSEFTAESASFATLVQNAKLALIGSRVLNAKATENIALALLSDSASFNITSSYVDSLTADADVGLIQQFDYSKVMLINSNITNCSCESNAIDLSGNSSLISSRAFFKANTLRSTATGAIILLRESSSAFVANSTMQQNAGKSIFTTEFSALKIYNSIFRNNIADVGGAVLCINSEVPVMITESVFSSNSVETGNGGAIEIVNSTVYITGSNFSENSAPGLGGAIRAEGVSHIGIFSCEFLENTADLKGGAISVYLSSLNISRSTLTKNSAGLQGGAIALDKATSLSMTDSVFTENAVVNPSSQTGNSDKGGALIFINTNPEVNLTIGKGSTFVANSAEAGGAIYFDSVDSRPVFSVPLIFLEGGVLPLGVGDGFVEFRNNTALHGKDIASAPHSLSWSGQDLELESNSFIDDQIFVNITDFFGEYVIGEVELTLLAEAINNVEGTFELGSVVTYDGRACFGRACPSSVTSQPNTIFRGRRNSTYAYRVRARSEFFFEEGVKRVVERETTDSTLEVIPCRVGQIIDPNGPGCLDCGVGQYQPFPPNTSTVCIPCAAGRFGVAQGAAICTECVGGITGGEGSSKCELCDQNEVPDRFSVTCVRCATNAVSLGTNQCQCLNDFYAIPENFDDNRQPVDCIDCPEGGVCDGLNTTVNEVNVDEGYWFSPWESQNTLKFVECRNEACSGGERDGDNCRDGYKGVLCTECQDDYQRVDTYDCSQCSGGTGLVIFRIVGTWILIFIIAFIITYVNISDAEKIARAHEKGEVGRLDTDASILMKILLNFLQFNTVASLFNYAWPGFVRGFLEAEALISASLNNLMNIDCALPSETSVPSYYINALIIALLPFVIPFLSLITLSIFICRRNVAHPNVIAPSKIQEKKEEENKSDMGSIMSRNSITQSRYQPNPNSLHHLLEARKSAAKEMSQRNSIETVKSDEAKASSLMQTTKIETKKSQEIVDASNNLSDTNKRTELSGIDPQVVSSELEPSRRQSIVVDRKRISILKRKKLRTIYNASNLSFTFMLYPTLVEQAFNLFNCESLTSSNDSYRFLPEMSQRCFQSPHLSWSIGLGVPMLAVYVIGFPLFLLNILYHFKSDLPNAWTSMRSISYEKAYINRRRSMHLHMLYDGYKHDFFFFEILVLLRKVLIVAISVFVVNNQAQTQLAILLIVLCIVIQQRLRPFELEECNSLEYWSLFTSFFTFFFGSFLYFSDDDVKLLASLVVFVINLIFFMHAMRMILRSVYREAVHTAKKMTKGEAKKMSVGQRVISYIGSLA